jgi:hypothetical protein
MYSPTTLVVRNAPMHHRKVMKCITTLNVFSDCVRQKRERYGMLHVIWNEHSPRIHDIF